MSAAVAPAATSKGLKLAEQAGFSGRPEDLLDFIANCEMVFAIQTDVYDRSDKKIVYALSLMKGKNASLWKTQYIRSNFRQGVNTDTWNLFKDKLAQAFPDIGRAQNAMQALVTMKQGNMPVEEFNTKFIIKGNTAGLDFGDTIQVHQGNQNITIPNPHLVTLINLYERALSPKLANQIIMNGAPETISGWMSRAAEVDSAQ